MPSPPELTFTKTRTAEIVTPAYLRREIRKRLTRDHFFRQLDDVRRAELLARLDSPTWLAGRNGETVGSVVRAAKSEALDAAILASIDRRNAAGFAKVVGPAALTCTRCGAVVEADRAEWLERQSDTGLYDRFGVGSRDRVRGAFPFDSPCFLAQLRDTAAALRAGR